MVKLKLSRLKRFALPLILFLTLIAYSNIFTHQFVWDDQKFILDWQTPKLGFSGVVPLLLGDTPVGHEGIYRPLRGLYYALSYRFFGESPPLYHVQALFIHLSATLAVYLILSLIFKRLWPVFFGALVFGLHPIHVESVTWVTSSFDTLGQTLALWAFYFYLRRWRLRSLLFTALAVFSHETASLIPVYLLLHDYFINRQVNLKKHLPYWLLVIIYWLIRIPLLHITSRQPYPFDGLGSTLWFMGQIILKYLQNLILPFNLTVNHPLGPGIQSLYWADLNYYSPPPAPPLLNPVLIISWLFIMALLILAFRFHRRFRFPAFALFWIFSSLIPFLQFFPISALYNERYLYLASFGWCVFIAWFSQQRLFHKPAVILIIPLLCYYPLKTIMRNRDWQNDFTLWQQAIRTNPYSNSNVTNLANTYFQNQDYTSAKKWYEKAQLLNPSQAITYTNLGIIAYYQNDKKTARKNFETALVLPVPSYLAHLYLGILAHQTDDYKTAEKEYETYRLRYPRYPDTYLYLGMLYHEQKRFDEALQAYLTAIALKPNYPDAYNNIGNLYRDEGKIAEAVKAYDMTLQLNPQHPYAANNLAEVLKLEKTLK